MKEKQVNININELDLPSSLKKLSYEEIRALCRSIREEIISATAKNGGHLSSNLGVVELTVALHRSFDFPQDKLIFDVGHQCYAHKILTGRKLDNLRQKDGVSGFQSMEESIYDCYSAGHSSTSISVSEGFAVKRTQVKGDWNIVVVIGDSSVTNGLAFEGLNNIQKKYGKVIIVINDNDMSISRPVGGINNLFRKISTGRGYNRIKTKFQRKALRNRFYRGLYNVSYAFKSCVKHLSVDSTVFDEMGFTYIGPVDGHNVKALEKAFSKAKNTTKSAIIHVETIKGKGYPFAENDKTGSWHGVSPFDPKTGKPIKEYETPSWSDFFGSLVQEAMKKDENLTLVVPATQKGSGLENAFKEFPDRSIDVGIAEEHAITMSGAMSINGIHPIASIYSTFLQRAYDELSHDVARLNANMTLLIERAGLSGNDGETHHGIYDVAFLKSIPHVTVAMPSSKEAAQALFKMSLEKRGLFAIRVPHGHVDMAKTSDKPIVFGRWSFLKETNDKNLAVLAIGPACMKLRDLIEENSLSLTLIDPVFLGKPHEDDLKELAGYKEILIYDQYGIEEGFAETILSSLQKIGYAGKTHVLALKNKFYPHGENEEILYEEGLTETQVLESIKNILKIS